MLLFAFMYFAIYYKQFFYWYIVLFNLKQIFIVVSCSAC